MADNIRPLSMFVSCMGFVIASSAYLAVKAGFVSKTLGYSLMIMSASVDVLRFRSKIPMEIFLAGMFGLFVSETLMDEKPLKPLIQSAVNYVFG